jgi:two-component system, NtrC family, sensor kinase
LKDKAEALEQQTATADILRVISRAPNDIQPVFDAIVQNAVKLCEGLFGTVLRLDGDRLHLAAHHNLSPAGLQAYREHYPVVVNLRETVASGAILDRRVVQVIDSNDPGVPPRSIAMARATGFRGVVVVPMLRDGEPIGVINIARQERGPFTERQVALLQTFADQAVIAIENVRLFKELEGRNTSRTSPTPGTNSPSAGRSLSDWATGLPSPRPSSARACRSVLSSFAASRYESSQTRRSDSFRHLPTKQ